MKLPSRKWWLVLLGCVALLIVIALVALPLLVDVDRFRPLIQAKAEEALGRKVELGGLSLSRMPLGVRVDSLSIAALPEEGGGKFLTAQSVRVGARLLPLLSKRLEVTSIRVVAPEVTLVRGADGRWNVQRLLASTEPAGAASAERSPDSTPPAFRVDSLRLSDGRIRLRDERRGGESPREVTLERIDLQLSDVAWTEDPIPFELSAVFGSGSSITLSAKGRIGPLAPKPNDPFQVGIEFALSGIDPTELAPWLQGAALPRGLQVEQPFSVEGIFEYADFPETGVRLQTTLQLVDAVVGFTALDGSRASAPFDFGLRAEVSLPEDGSPVQLSDVQLRFAEHRLGLKGTIANEDPLHRVDVELGPGQLPVNDLTKLAALIGVALPVRVSSSVPLEFEGRLHGLVGPGRTPELEAQVILDDLTLNHASMARPIEKVGARLALKGQHLEVTDLAGVVGSSDVAGRVTLDGFASPRVEFDLHSRVADFGELFSFLDSPTKAPAQSGSGPAGDRADDPLARLKLEGRIRIDRGTFRTLDFTALEAGMTYADQVLTLDPVTMQLYDGTFRGRIENDLGQEPPTFEIRGDAREVDVEAFIGDNLESRGLLAGRFSGKLETHGSGADFESIVRSLDGEGSVKIDRGQLGRLNVLERLSGVSGLFGASTLQSLTGQLATEGTEFELLSGDLTVGGGEMQLRNLLFDSPVFDLEGEGVVDLLAAGLDGRFRLSFSPEISAAMRSDHSRAARAFWNSSTRRVELPLTLSGPFHAPMPGIDFEEVAENLVKQEVRDYLGERLGLQPDDSEPTAPPSDQAAAPAAERLPDVTHDDLTIEFGRPEWRGSFLARDLQVSGTVRGSSIDRAEVTIVDFEGREQFRVARQEHIEAQLSSAADREAAAAIDWRILLDGKQLLQAEYPLIVTVTLFNTAGESARASLQVDR